MVTGTALTDTAELSGGNNPTGTITFTLADPGNTVVYTDHVPVTGNGTCTTATGDNPGGYTPTTAGTYTWAAVYSGDSGNNGYTAAAEQQTVSKASQAITFTSTAPSNAAAGGPAYQVTATGGGSGQPVVFTVDPATTGNACSLGADGVTVSMDHAGTCVIDAGQAGNAGYNPAPQAQQSSRWARARQ